MTPESRCVSPRAETFAIPRRRVTVPGCDTGRVTIPRPPRGAGPSGRRLWGSVVRDFELGEHERALLTAMVRQVDRLDELEELIAAEGLMTSGHNTTKVHPAVVEARQTAIAVARIAACLRLPAGEEDEEPAQRRGGARGVYTIHGGAA
jgi:hypothetical protein